MKVYLLSMFASHLTKGATRMNEVSLFRLYLLRAMLPAYPFSLMPRFIERCLSSSTSHYECIKTLSAIEASIGFLEIILFTIRKRTLFDDPNTIIVFGIGRPLDIGIPFYLAL